MVSSACKPFPPPSSTGIAAWLVDRQPAPLRSAAATAAQARLQALYAQTDGLPLPLQALSWPPALLGLRRLALCQRQLIDPRSGNAQGRGRGFGRVANTHAGRQCL